MEINSSIRMLCNYGRHMKEIFQKSLNLHSNFRDIDYQEVFLYRLLDEISGLNPHSNGSAASFNTIASEINYIGI